MKNTLNQPPNEWEHQPAMSFCCHVAMPPPAARFLDKLRHARCSKRWWLVARSGIGTRALRRRRNNHLLRHTAFTYIPHSFSSSRLQQALAARGAQRHLHQGAAPAAPVGMLCPELRTPAAITKLTCCATASLQQALAAGGAQRQWHQGAAPAALNHALGGVAGPDWLAQPPARNALLAIAQSALQ